MDVLIVREYMETKKQRAMVSSQLSILRRKLSGLEVKESCLAIKVDSDSLITAKSVRVINELLFSHHQLQLGGFPVSFVRVATKNSQLNIQVIFSQPLFSGWETKEPYVSYQCCSWQLETPDPPSKNHVPQYKQVMECTWDIVCWEIMENGLRLWIDDKRGLEFKWNTEEVTAYKQKPVNITNITGNP